MQLGQRVLISLSAVLLCTLFVVYLDRALHPPIKKGIKLSPGTYGYHYVRVERIEPSERAYLHSSSASDKKLKLLPSQLLPRVQRGVATVKDEEKYIPREG